MKKILRKKKIGVLMGGTSSEREVSLRSGTAILKALKSIKYNAVPIDVNDDICSVLKKKHIDVAFVALHGGHGENGAVQGMLEVMGIPYTGSGMLSSALAMDKEASKKVFLYHGIPVPPFKVVHSYEFLANSLKKKTKQRTKSTELKTGFVMPWVIKPVSEGSSVGVEIVKERSKLGKALRSAFRYGNKVLIEKYIAGKEIHIGILNDKVLGGVEVRPSLEFYNYKAKYTTGLTEYILPPPLGISVYKSAQNVALAAHKALGCSGATRVDLRVDKHGNPFVLEVNTIPGMTETSLLPKIAYQAGLSFNVLIEEILGGVHAG